jgi:hypothetical protein
MGREGEGRVSSPGARPRRRSSEEFPAGRLIEKPKELRMFREEVARIEGLAERINKLRGSL